MPQTSLCKLVYLRCGKPVSVDEIDYWYLLNWSWSLHSEGYAYRRSRPKKIYMHREVAIRAGLIAIKIDHVDQNKLNNTRINLRESNQSLNGANSPISSNNSSGFKGVTWNKASKVWVAQIGVNTKIINLGRYYCKKQAAIAYNIAAIKYFGEHASLNKVD